RVGHRHRAAAFADDLVALDLRLAGDDLPVGDHRGADRAALRDDRVLRLDVGRHLGLDGLAARSALAGIGLRAAGAEERTVLAVGAAALRVVDRDRDPAVGAEEELGIRAGNPRRARGTRALRDGDRGIA